MGGVLKPSAGRELLGWVIILLGLGALQLPALGRMAQQGVDIIEFELMRTTSGAARLLAYLGEDGIDAARQQLYLDFGLLVAYGVVISAACMMLAQRAETGWVAKFGPLFGRLSILAALCDAIENVALLIVLSNHPGQPWPALATGFATVKFVLLALAIAYLVIGWLSTLGGQRHPSPAAQD
jgi:hypothetical protein